MAKIGFSTNDPLTMKAWDKLLFIDTMKEIYFMKWMGNSAEHIVHVKTQLTKQKGDNITFGIRMRLLGDGVEENETLENNEEKLITHDFDMTLKRYRNAVRDAGSLDRQKVMFSITEEGRSALKDWMAEKMDKLCFEALDEAATTIIYGGDATSNVSIESGDKITPSLVRKIKVLALTGRNRRQTPLRPIRIKGRKYFVLLVHPDVMFDLKENDAFEQARREAEVRGKENPIFSGSEAIYDGVVIHEHENIPIVTNLGAGSDVAGSRGVLMGAQALVWAWGVRPSTVNEAFDYQEELGSAIRITARCKKPTFNGLNYGSFQIVTSRTRISDDPNL